MLITVFVKLMLVQQGATYLPKSLELAILQEQLWALQIYFVYQSYQEMLYLQCLNSGSTKKAVGYH